MKKLLATILALVMALSLCTIGWADVTTVKDETELKNAVANGGEIKLAKSISLTETMEVKGGKSVVIDMNGYDITATSSAAFKIENGSLRITGNGTVSGGTGRIISWFICSVQRNRVRQIIAHLLSMKM